MKLYYNPRLDALGISDTGYEMVATLKFVPVLSNYAKLSAKALGEDSDILNGADGLDYAAYETAMPMTEDWVEIGSF